MSLPTSKEVYDRLKWDERFDLDRCQIVYTTRPSGSKAVPFREFDIENVPFHRIVEFRRDNQVFWSRPERIDRIDEFAARFGFHRSDAGGDVERVPAAALPTLPLVARRFDAVSSSWVPVGDEPSLTATTLRIVTWNVLFDRFEAELLDSDWRWARLFEELAASNADLIALQEVTPVLLARLLASSWARGYTVSDAAPGDSVTPHGQILLSRVPVREVSYSMLGPSRRALWVRLGLGSLHVGVAIVHLASNRSPNPQETRAAEIRAVLAHVAATRRSAWLIAGDFNSNEEEHDAVLRGADAVDAWRALRDDSGWTYDVDRNTLAGALSQSRRSGRFDRVLSIAGADARLVPRSVRLVGTEPRDGRYVSDHYGVEAAFEVQSVAAETAALATSKRSALVLLPPRAQWGSVQRIRSQHDRGFDRWPPHVTVLFEFLDTARLLEVARIVDGIAARRRPFEIVFDRATCFTQAEELTLVLEASGGGRANLTALRNELLGQLPQLRTGTYEFRPHLTVARVPKGAQEFAALEAEVDALRGTLQWTVDRLVILERRDDGAFSIAHEALLAGATAGGHATAQAPPAIIGHVASVAEQLARRRLLVEPFGSARYAPALAADVDLVVLAGRHTPASFANELAGALVATPRSLIDMPTSGLWSGPQGELRPVPGEGVVALRGRVHGQDVDVSVVFADGYVDVDDPTLPEGARRALLGPRDAAALVERLHKHGRYEAFCGLLPLLRQWTDARALRSNAFGYTSSFGWAVLLAAGLLHDRTLAGVDADQGFGPWLHWLASLPVGVEVTLDGPPEEPTGKRLRIRSPAAPFRNAARAFTRSTDRVVREEAILAARRAKSATHSAQALALAAVPLAADEPRGTLLRIQGTDAVRGQYEGAYLSLLNLLEGEASAWVRPWGRFEIASEGWTHRFAVQGNESAAAVVVNRWLDRSFAAAVRPTLQTPL